MKVVKPKKIGNKDYLEFGAWQTLGRFFGSTVGVEWTKPVVDEKGAIRGYEARAEVLQHGVRISAAEASCLRAERNWASRDEFALKSMAQTSASAKALRNAFGWVAELAGYASTPAEEMVVEEEYDTTPIKATAKIISTGDDTRGIAPVSDRTIREEIRDLLDSKAKEPFLEGEDYKRVCLDLTGLDLIPSNYQSVLERLKAI